MEVDIVEYPDLVMRGRTVMSRLAVQIMSYIILDCRTPFRGMRTDLAFGKFT
jgi:hypothetical protein